MADRMPPIMVMGAQGTGKSTLGEAIAGRLGLPFVDGDELHSDANKAKMASGHPLTDADRESWLHEVARVLASGRARGIVVVCSALKRSYRDLIRQTVPEVFVVDPEGPIGLVAQRIGGRTHEFMPTSLLKSQYDTLEPLEADEHGIIVDIAHTPQELTEQVLARLSAGSGA